MTTTSPTSNTAGTVSKLDIALIAGIATWSVPAQHMNLRWLTKPRLENNNKNSTINGRSLDSIAGWACISPSELDVNGTELVRSPRSALAVMRHGIRVRDLCDTDLPAIHATSRKAKLTNAETAKRIELDRTRRDALRHEVLATYRELCESYSQTDIVRAVRRFLFKGRMPGNPARIASAASARSAASSSARRRERQQQQQQQQQEDDDEDIFDNEDFFEYEDEEEEEDEAAAAGENSGGDFVSQFVGQVFQNIGLPRENNREEEQSTSASLYDEDDVDDVLIVHDGTHDHHQRYQYHQHHDDQHAESEEQQRQHNIHNNRNFTIQQRNNNNDNNHQRCNQEQKRQRQRQDEPEFFSQLTSMPSYEARSLLGENEVRYIVAMRDKEAARLRKRLAIQAAHKSSRILHELALVEKLQDDAATVQGAQRASTTLMERQRAVAERNQARLERAERRKEELRMEREERVLMLDEKNARVDEHVERVLESRKRVFKSQQEKNFRAKQQRRLQEALDAAKEEREMMRSYGGGGGGGGAAASSSVSQHASTPQPQKSAAAMQRQQQREGNRTPSVAASSSSSRVYAAGSSAAAVAAKRRHKQDQDQNKKQQTQKNVDAGQAQYQQSKFTTSDAFFVDDLMLEWRAQNVHAERRRVAEEQARRRDQAQAGVAETRRRIQLDRDWQRDMAHRREEMRSESAVANKQVIASRVRGSVALLEHRTSVARQHVDDVDRHRREVFTSERDERMRRSEALLEEQARAAREACVTHLFANDASESWREQRRERERAFGDAKQVLLLAQMEDIEEDGRRRRAMREQLQREQHLLRKTGFNAREHLVDEEKLLLEELGLKTI